MPSLLEQAIVDAKTLREAALKNAETAVVNKYSNEVREALDKLLERDELGMDTDFEGEGMGFEDEGMGFEDEMPAMPAMPGEEGELEVEDSIEGDVMEVPYAATDDFRNMNVNGRNLKTLPAEGDEVEITLDLGALRESLEAASAEDEDIEIDLTEGDDEDDDAFELYEVFDDDDESIELNELFGEEDDEDDDLDLLLGEDEPEGQFSDEFIESIAERLTVDMGSSLSGWAGRSSYDKIYEIEKELASRRSTGVEEELKTLKSAQEELTFENKQLREHLDKYKQATVGLKDTLQNINLSNARLLYTNRVLRNTSLNERQKDRIVEEISKADSAVEAKTIFRTLESTVEAKPMRSPQSLSEAISRPSSVLRATHREVQTADPFAERMKKLAGIV